VSAPIRLRQALAELELPPPPPSRCTCGHTRVRHLGGGACRLCRCGGFVKHEEAVRALPHWDAPLTPQERRRVPTAIRPPTARQSAKRERDEVIRTLRTQGVTVGRIAEAMGVAKRTVERVLSVDEQVAA
jgi:hypothetical protein